MAPLKYCRGLVAATAAVLLCWAPLPMAGEVTRVAVISDINGRYGSTAYHKRVAEAVNHIIDLQPQLVISTGDMVAGQRPSPKLQRAELEKMWQSFHTHVRKPLEDAGIPLFMTPGNHDASAYPGYELEREAYAAYHKRHPPRASLSRPGQFPYHYALDYQGLLLVSLDATQSGRLPESQHHWLAATLDAATDSRATVVFGHLPLQPVAVGREKDVIADRDLEALMAASGVTIYLSGHHHAFYPGYRRGIEMVSVGNLGGNLRKLTGTQQTTGFSFTVLEFDPSGGLTIKALKAPGFDTPLNITALPGELGRGEKKLLRRDLVPQHQETGAPRSAKHQMKQERE